MIKTILPDKNGPPTYLTIHFILFSLTLHLQKKTKIPSLYGNNHLIFTDIDFFFCFTDWQQGDCTMSVKVFLFQFYVQMALLMLLTESVDNKQWSEEEPARRTFDDMILKNYAF